MVGTQLGTVYSGQQGNQLATVIRPNNNLATYEAFLAKDKKKKEADAANFSKGALDVKPEEVWHFYSGDLQKTWEGWFNKGAELMPGGDPWKRSDKAAIDWQIEGSRIKAANTNVKQAKALWDKAMGDINTRGDEYTDEYKAQVRDFAVNNPFDKIMTGQFNFPQAEFKDPSTIHQDFLVGGLANVEKAAGKDAVPTDADFNNYTVSYFSTPEAEKNVIAAKQMFGKLSPDDQNAYITKAQNTPGFKGEGWMAYMNDQLQNRYKKPELDIAAEAIKRAADAPLDKSAYSGEDMSQITTSSSKTYLSNKAYPQEQATSFFTKNSWAISEPKYAEQLGVDPNLPLEERRKKMIAAMAKQIEKNIETESEYRMSRGGTGNASDKEKAISHDEWRRNIGSDDPAKSTEAANWLVQGLGLKGTVATSAFVSRNEYNINEGAKRAYDQYRVGKPASADKFKVLQIVFKNRDEMEAAKEKMFKELDEAAVPASDKQKYSDLMDYYRKEGSYGSVLKIPIVQENEQILKRIHDKNVKESGELYKPIGNKYNAGSSVQQKNAERFNRNPNTTITGSNDSDPLNIRQ
jgi:hypothetical protein